MSAPAVASSRPNGQLANGPATGEQQHELRKMSPSPSRVPVEEDIMQLARLGEIGAIQKLFNSGKFDANYADAEGITPLHWAAINNHYALCHFLIQSGANVNAKGGEAVATPVLWAAKKCNYYVVHLLIQNGADPLLTDDQGFNLLHSATLDGNIFQLVLLLYQDIPIDIPDSQGHTSLMWAAYKGYPACVDLFLRWGANVYARDDQGFTALHWALVRGSAPCTLKLIEYGSDRFAETNEGKTPAIVAQEMKSTHQWHRALAECGYNADGSPKSFPLSPIVKDKRTFVSRFFFLWPFVVIFCVVYILSHMVVYAAIPVGLFVAYSLQVVASQLLRWAPSDMKHIHRTPFLAGIFAGTLFWVGVQWIMRILPWTYMSNPFLNILFGALYGLCAYFYFRTMLEDPGYVPKLGSRSQQKAVIEELVEARKFDEQNFCTHCMVRRPLRSKHCKRCSRCIAKEDHHCPWVDNCVGTNNHRHFLLYIITLEIGVLALLWLTLAYLAVLPPMPGLHCNILKDEFCAVLNKDPFTIIMSAWASLQLVWVTMLLLVQLLQIARAQTTYENMRGHLHGHGAGEALTSFVTSGTPSVEGAQLTASGAGPDPAVPQHRAKEGCWDQWVRLLGLDTFVATALHGSNAAQVLARQRANPFTRGVWTNCADFWCAPAPIFGTPDGEALLGGERINYTTMYEVPARTRVRRRRAEEGAEYMAVDNGDSV